MRPLIQCIAALAIVSGVIVSITNVGLAEARGQSKEKATNMSTVLSSYVPLNRLPDSLRLTIKNDGPNEVEVEDWNGRFPGKVIIKHGPDTYVLYDSYVRGCLLFKSPIPSRTRLKPGQFYVFNLRLDDDYVLLTSAEQQARDWKKEIKDRRSCTVYVEFSYKDEIMRSNDLTY